jgi:hypothetical protein
LVAAPQTPVASQVRTALPEHCVEEGTQTPVHAPPTHAELVQGWGGDHVPVVSQVWTPLLEQRVVPGVHDPVHAPSTHAYGHALAVPHVPFAVHVSRPVPEHCVSKGAQTPVQAPPIQAWKEHATGGPHTEPTHA